MCIGLYYRDWHAEGGGWGSQMVAADGGGLGVGSKGALA